MYRAIGVEPTNDTARIDGCTSSASTASLSPCTTLNTPSGNHASLRSSPMRSDNVESRSDGFRMNVLPQAIATGNIHIGTMAGKLNGVMPAHTPSGWRNDQLSMPPPTLSLCWPFSSCGIPHANSTTSRPRVSSPFASLSVLPCSRVINAAISPKCVSSSSLNLNSTRARFSAGVSLQPGRAALAAATERSTTLSAARFEFLDLLVERGRLLLHGADHAVVLVDGRVALLDRTVLVVDDFREALQIDFTRGHELFHLLLARHHFVEARLAAVGQRRK